MTDDSPTGRMSPLLCIDCEQFYDEVNENDIINAVTAAHLHKAVCPNRDKPTGGLTDKQIDAQRLTKPVCSCEGILMIPNCEHTLRAEARRIEAIVRKETIWRARQHIWVRKGVQRAKCCRAALEDARVTLLDDEPENFSPKSEGP